ncbi:MAG: hypothetical protein LUI12_03840 [Clostridiales bacterium]|nr:hypothetical protein [Clostridiales bacterium]
MNKLLQLHDKVKYHRYREDIVLNASRCHQYVHAFTSLLDAFQKEIDSARLIPLPERTQSQRMLVEAENRCFMIDARRKLSLLEKSGEIYRYEGGYETEQQIRLLMAQLESALSSIHEYIAYGKIRFLLRYPSDDTMDVIRMAWKGTDYA